MKSCKKIKVCIKNFDVNMVIIDDNYYRYYRCVSPNKRAFESKRKIEVSWGLKVWKFLSSYRVLFFTVPPDFQYQNEKQVAANQDYFFKKFSM